MVNISYFWGILSMNSQESVRRVQKLRRKRSGKYFFQIVLIPLVAGILYLGIKVSLPLLEKQKLHPLYAKAENKNIISEEKTEGETVETNQYQIPFREKVNDIIRESINDKNIIKSTVDVWEPKVTSQSSPHVVKYGYESIDFFEMEEAAANALNLTKQDFSVWHLSRGYDDQSVILYVATTGLTYKYKVYLHWVDNKGWLPILVQEVKELKYT